MQSTRTPRSLSAIVGGVPGSILYFFGRGIEAAGSDEDGEQTTSWWVR